MYVSLVTPHVMQRQVMQDQFNQLHGSHFLFGGGRAMYVTSKVHTNKGTKICTERTIPKRREISLNKRNLGILLPLPRRFCFAGVGLFVCLLAT